MSGSIGYDDTWKRDVGYGVPATCDHPGCGEEIDRGLSHVCGGEAYGGEHGCGLFFCRKHLHMAGSQRDHALLCARCWSGRCDPFVPTPDTAKWCQHKLIDPSWAEWRETHPDEVRHIRAVVVR